MKTAFFPFFAVINLGICYCNIIDTSKELSQLVEKFESKFTDVYKKLEEKDESIKILEEKLAYQERVIHQLNRQLTMLERQGSSGATAAVVRRERQEETVAFMAYLDHELANLGPDHVIPFGAVELNEGSAFNNLTGIFTVPVDGLYMFSFAVEDYHGHRLWTKLVVDSQLKASVIEWPDPGHNAQGSNTAVLRLQTGQSVWVAVDSRESGDSLQGWSNLRSTTFTGRQVAFTAYLGHDISQLEPNHIIPFGAVELNEGSAYSSHTGMFSS